MAEPRRIYTRIVMQWDDEDLKVIQSESYVHDGPVALCVDGRGDASNNNGRGDSESGNGSSGRGGGSSDGGREGVGNRTASRGGMAAENERGGLGQTSNKSGGSSSNRSFGSADAAYSRAEAVAREAASRNGGVSLGNPSFGSVDAAYSRSIHAATPDMRDQITELTGRPVTRTDVGYVDDTGTRMAYSTGNPTSFGAQATANAHDLGMSWAGGKAMSDMASTARAKDMHAKAREIQKMAVERLKDPMALGIDPHMAKAAYDDAMHGMYDKAVSVGAMTPEEAAAVGKSFGGVAGAFGFGLDDVTTPYESFVDAVDQGLVDPTTGKLTAKGYINVASPAIGLLAGPLASIGLSAFGIPGAVVGALAPGLVQSMTQPKKSKGVDAATSLASKVTGVDMSPFGAAAAYADTMNTMGKAQSYAGTAPERTGGMDASRGDGGGTDSLVAGLERFFTKKAPAAAPQGEPVNPRFQQRLAGGSGQRQPAGTQPTKPSVLDAALTQTQQRFFTRRA
jgi:hypothetical protein